MSDYRQTEWRRPHNRWLVLLRQSAVEYSGERTPRANPAIRSFVRSCTKSHQPPEIRSLSTALKVDKLLTRQFLNCCRSEIRPSIPNTLLLGGLGTLVGPSRARRWVRRSARPSSPTAFSSARRCCPGQSYSAAQLDAEMKATRAT